MTKTVFVSELVQEDTYLGLLNMSSPIKEQTIYLVMYHK